MGKIIFNGRHDKFKLVCKDGHNNFKQNKLSGRMLKGSKVQCLECESEGIVFDDGGIYKLMQADKNIELRVVD